MKVTIDINESRFPFFMELLKSLNFVKAVDKEGQTISSDITLTHFASEKSLSKDWLTLEEDKAWKDL